MKALLIAAAIVSAWVSGVATENAITQSSNRVMNGAAVLAMVAVLCGMAAWWW